MTIAHGAWLWRSPSSAREYVQYYVKGGGAQTATVCECNDAREQKAHNSVLT